MSLASRFRSSGLNSVTCADMLAVSFLMTSLGSGSWATALAAVHGRAVVVNDILLVIEQANESGLGRVVLS